MLGTDLVNERIDKQKLESVLPIFMRWKITQHQSKEEKQWLVCSIKTINEFLKQ